MYTVLRQRARIAVVASKISKLQAELGSFSKDFVESEHPRADDGQFTSGGGGNTSTDSKPKADSKAQDGDKPGAGVLRTLIGVIVGVKGAGFTAGLVAASLAAMGVPIAAVIAAAGISGLVVGRGLYNVITKAKGIKFKTEAAARKFLAELPKHLSDKQLAELHTKLQAKTKELGIKA